MNDPPVAENAKALPQPTLTLPEIVGVPMSAQAVAELVQQSVEAMAAELGCTRLLAMACLPREATVRGVTTVGFRADGLRGLTLSLAEFAAAERALRTGQTLVLPDGSGLPNALAPHFSGELVLVPFLLGKRSLAVMIGQVGAGVAARSAAWQQRAQEVAARGAYLIELERVASAYQNELHLRQASRVVAAAILEGHPLHEIAALITETIALQLNEERVALYLRDSTGKFRPISLRNVSAEYGENIVNLTRPPIFSRATATGLPNYARNVQQDMSISAEARALFARENITSILLATLQHEQTIHGVLAVYPLADRHFTPADLAAFQAFTDMATLGVAIALQMEQEKQFAVAEERNRLAREIHDTVAQSLAGLIFQIETTQNLLDAKEEAAAREMLGSARSLARKALEDTRRAVQGLGPQSLEWLSPGEAISEELRRFEAQEGIATGFLMTGEEPELNPEQRLTLLRITQETLSNIRKHAQARRVRVALQYGADSVALIIEDDGIGFDVEARAEPGPEGGYGLFGMSERARVVGGEVRIESTPGWGTTVRALLPFRPVSALPVRAPLPIALPSSVETPPSVLRPNIPVAADRSRDGLFPPVTLDGNRLRVLIVEDQAMVRQGIRAVLEASGEIVVIGEAEDGEQALDRARTLRPDVTLMDIQMPRVDGLEALRRIRAELPYLSIVMLTTFLTDDAVKEAIGAGAKGYLLKDAEPADLIATVRAAGRGEALLSPAVTERLSSVASGQATKGSAVTGGLNEREMEVLMLLIQGARNKEIAAGLFITTSTVEYHLANIYNKLEASNRTEAVRKALELGLGAKR